jgi:hypothetical protein
MLNVLGIPALDDREALANLLDALDIAENAARQMALYRDQPAWILVANALGTTRSRCSQLGQRSFGAS